MRSGWERLGLLAIACFLHFSLGQSARRVGSTPLASTVFSRGALLPAFTALSLLLALDEQVQVPLLDDFSRVVLYFLDERSVEGVGFVQFPMPV